MVPSSSPPPTTYKKKKILIVDDDPDITFSLKKALEEYNEHVHRKEGLFELVVDTFTDPTDVISNYNQPGMYDLLIIDIVMPRMNGFELYEKVKEIDDKAKACFITAHEVYYESLRDLFPSFDVDCFMKKPIENEDLLRKVLSAI
ncbi:MAG: response regulator [Nitrososphaeraceae archaeon]|nr:response regulator [Nitrososphaeraceae archaeon]MBV9667599.1 response regulator [Nitrososphaeraceae archaeon]